MEDEEEQNDEVEKRCNYYENKDDYEEEEDEGRGPLMDYQSDYGLGRVETINIS